MLEEPGLRPLKEKEMNMTPSAVDANHNLSQRFEYPKEEWRIVRQLVRLIGSAKTWQDMVEASDALFQVEMRAKCMRDEDIATKGQINQALSQSVQGRAEPGWDR